MTSDIDESKRLGDIDEINAETADALRDEGYEVVSDLQNTERTDLYEIDGIGAAAASRLLTLTEGSDSEADGDAAEGGDEADQGRETSEGGGESDSDEDDEGDGSTTVGLLDVRNEVVEVAPQLVGRDLDGVIEVTKRDGGWLAVVEMIERKSVPDTQDILGRYEVEFSDTGQVTGYRRVNRYRRTESNPDEF